MRRFFSFAIVGLYSILFLSPQVVRAQQCPVYTHKTTTVGIRDSLPDGWFVFGLSTANGLFKCNTKSDTPTVIPGTLTDHIVDIDIADDGQWILYLVQGPSSGGRIWKNFLFMIKPDGSGRTQVPLIIDSSSMATFPCYAQFYRHSPLGFEIAYISGYGRVRAISYHFDNLGNVVFGATRTLVDFLSNPADSSSEMYANIDPTLNRQISVCKNEVFMSVFVPTSPGAINPFTCVRTSYITIPNQGLGTAHFKNIYSWLNDDHSTWWGCGLAISIDGSLCLANSNAVGGAAGCVPNAQTNPQMDHKGFYVTRFMYDTMPPIPRDSVILSPAYGISINWCPAQNRIGSWDQLGFGQWSFSNSNEWVIGEQEGTNTPTRGVWVINIPTNTWTLAYTSSGGSIRTPALFLAKVTQVRHGLQPHAKMPMRPSVEKLPCATTFVTLEPMVYRCELYSLAGKLLWKYSRHDAARRMSVRIPGYLRANNTIIAKFL
jgi:hypothetical protein